LWFAPTVTHGASVESDHEQSRVASIVSVPVPPPGLKEEGAPVAVT
jgi:hypothetical protein